jgi:hypothetical protein
MAYELTYTANFTNEQNQLVEVNIYELDPDVIPTSAENYQVTSLKISANSEDQDLYATIISKELQLGLWCESSQVLTWESFISYEYTKWKITVDIDSVNMFTGFLTPEESYGPLQDKPYEIILTATDGLGLLKGYELRKVNGDKFNALHYLKDYIAGALYKTGLDLDIKIYSCLFYNGNLDKGDGLQYDMFNQNKVNWRTFLKDSTTYENCYDSLKILLGGWCSIVQHEGKWQIMLLSERQYVPDKWYWVNYDYTGTYDTSGYVTSISSDVGKDEEMYAINENQVISSRVAYKQSKTIYYYESPQELIINSNLQNLGNFLSGLSGTYNRAYALYEWSRWQNALNVKTAYSGSGPDYINVEIDEFGNQTDRYFAVEGDLTTFKFIQNNNDDFYVDESDKITIGISMRMKLNGALGGEMLSSSGWTTTGWSGSFAGGFTHNIGNTSTLSNSVSATANNYYKVTLTITGRTNGAVDIGFGGGSVKDITHSGQYELKTSSTAGFSITPTSSFDGTIVISLKLITISSGYALRPILSVQRDGTDGTSVYDYYTLNTNGAWINDVAFYFTYLDPANDDVTQWKNVTIEAANFPVSGIVKLSLYAWNVDGGNIAEYKDIKVTYIPYVRGSYQELLGDYHLNAQTTNYPDKFEQEVKISDSPKRIIKGAMFADLSGTNYLIKTSWYRYPNSEVLNFKQAVNYGRYNQGYRRFYKIEGDFTALTNLSLHKQYRFVDLTPDRWFVILPSLEMNLITGNSQVVFVEVKKDSNDGTQTGTTDEFNYIFK